MFIVISTFFDSCLLSFPLRKKKVEVKLRVKIKTLSQLLHVRHAPSSIGLVFLPFKKKKYIIFLLLIKPLDLHFRGWEGNTSCIIQDRLHASQTRKTNVENQYAILSVSWKPHSRRNPHQKTHQWDWRENESLSLLFREGKKRKTYQRALTSISRETLIPIERRETSGREGRIFCFYISGLMLQVKYRRNDSPKWGFHRKHLTMLALNKFCGGLSSSSIQVHLLTQSNPDGEKHKAFAMQIYTESLKLFANEAILMSGV